MQRPVVLGSQLTGFKIDSISLVMFCPRDEGSGYLGSKISHVRVAATFMALLPSHFHSIHLHIHYPFRARDTQDRLLRVVARGHGDEAQQGGDRKQDTNLHLYSR
jgi:hypothetical protein